MRKSSSFMCILVVLLAGGAEAQRPLAKEALFGLVSLGFKSGVDAWTVGATSSANPLIIPHTLRTSPPRGALRLVDRASSA